MRYLSYRQQKSPEQSWQMRGFYNEATMKQLDKAVELINEAKAAIDKNNTGNRNTGNFNTGDWNTGNFNTGDCNTGNFNTGDWNTGNRNTGNRNTGDWNTGNRNTGYFNTKTPKTIKVFGKKCLREDWAKANKPNCLYFSLTEWVYESDMSDVEKQENPSYSHTGGYLKAFNYKEAFAKSVTEASKEDRDLIRALPNFDADIFLEISGVDLRLLDTNEI